MIRGVIDGELTLDKAIEKLLPSQKDFLGAPEKFAAYIGGFGSGKTVSLSMAAILRANETPNGLSLIGRATIPALKDTTRRTFLELFPYDWLKDGKNGWKETDGGGGRLIHKNGHEFLFRHLDLSDPHVRAHVRSLNLSAFYFDEAPEVSEETYFTLVGRLRRQNVSFRCGRLAGNPAGQDWIWRNFFDEKRRDALKRLNRGILAPTTENTNLPEDYIADMVNVYPQDWADRYIYASFADFSDKVFKDWDERIHTFDCDQKHEAVFGEGQHHPPADWPVVVGCDIGGVDPWHLIFFAVEPVTGNLFGFAEIHETGILCAEISRKFWDIMQGRSFDGMAYDYENQQAAMELAAEGVPGSPANKNVHAGILKVAQYLHPDKRLIHPFIGISEAPRVFFCRNCCKQTIRALSGHSWGKTRAGQPTGKPADDEHAHGADAVRYAIHTFRPEPKKLKPRAAWENEELSMLARQFWKDVERAQQKKPRTKPRFTYRSMHV